VPEVTSVLQQHGDFEVCAHDVQLNYSHLSAEAVLKVRVGGWGRKPWSKARGGGARKA
jgi:hypothetical protein